MSKRITDDQAKPEQMTGPVGSLAECVPAILAMGLYIAFQFRLPLRSPIYFFFWPCSIWAAMAALFWLVSGRRRGPQAATWYAQAQTACHSVVLIVLAVVILLAVAAAMVR
jgi:hypothetical protein